jgi:hypothetical protein
LVRAAQAQQVMVLQAHLEAILLFLLLRHLAVVLVDAMVIQAHLVVTA